MCLATAHNPDHDPWHENHCPGCDVTLACLCAKTSENHLCPACKEKSVVLA